MKLSYFALPLAGVLLAGCASVGDQLTTEGYAKMSGAEIAVALPGNSLDGEDRDGDYVIFYTSADAMKIKYQGRVEEGVWRVDGDQYCRQWATFGGGKERCVDLYRSGGSIKWVRNGKVTDRSVLVAGNPANL